jgi:DNA-binding MarR family transcriptional regulator
LIWKHIKSGSKGYDEWPISEEMLSAGRIKKKKLMEQLKDTGLTLGQPKVLDYLKEHDGASQKEIAAGCLIEAGSLTSILNRMEEKDLIERKMLNGNRRTFHIFMTESGKKNQRLVEEAFKKIEKTALNGISEEEQKQFMDIFCRIYRNLADMK